MWPEWQSLYCISKVGVIRLTRCLGAEFIKHRIRVNRSTTWLFLAVWLAATQLAEAVIYPGLPPGPARATHSAAGMTLENDVIAMRWRAVLRDGANYVRQEVMISAMGDNHQTR